MYIAITGATGFLGRYIVRRLADAGHRLRCWHRPTSDRGGFDEMADKIEWRLGDLGDVASTASLVQGVDAVVHAAVDWEGPRNRQFERQPGRGQQAGQGDYFEDFIAHNLMGSLRLFQAAFTAGVQRFVHISTCAVHEVILEDRPLDETHPLWATSHYGAHKGALEKFVHSFGFGQGWPICALRPTGIYGLAHPASQSRWYDLVGQVLRGEPISSSRGGKEVHAADVARAVEVLLGADASTIAGQAYNCYDMYVAEQDVAGIAKQLSGSSSVIADLNRGPKHQIVTAKIRKLGMTFAGSEILRQTVAALVRAHGGKG